MNSFFFIFLTDTVISLALLLWTWRSHNATSRSDAAVDDMTFTWIELKRINYDLPIDGSQDQALINHLVTRIPIVERQDEKYKKAELAFHTGERHLPGGTKASDFVHDELAEYYNKCNQTEYLASYISIAGPSGIGKSFTVQQVSIFHGTYVVYVSFARGSTYPS